MEQKDNFPLDEGEKASSSDDKREEKVNRIEAELRNIISNMSAPNPESLPEKQTPKSDEIGLQDSIDVSAPLSPFSDILPPPPAPLSKPIEPAFSAEPDEMPSSTTPSDADFWKGNVLGWGTAEETTLQDDSSISLPPGPAPFRIDVPSKGSNPSPLSKPEEPETPPVSSSTPPQEDRRIPRELEIELPPVDITTGLPVKIPMEKKMDEVDTDALTDDSLLKIFPIPPEAVEFAAEIPTRSMPVAPKPDAESAAENTLNEFLSPPAEPVLPKESNRMSDTGVESSSDLGFDEAKIKPDHLVQVACIVPAGEELKAQAFYRMLRDAAVKSPQKFDVQAVLIHDWEPDRIDLEAWEKSALLSGAEILFIIVHKKDAEKFQSLIKKSLEKNLKKRLIFVEHIPLKNLYSDLLIHLREKPQWRKST